jgi:hypothetical protein
LKLQADPIAADALDSSPTIQAVACTPDYEAQTQLAALDVIPRFC